MKTAPESDGLSRKVKKVKKVVSGDSETPVNIVPPLSQPISTLSPEFVKLLNEKLVQKLQDEIKHPKKPTKENTEKISCIKDLKILENVVCEFLKTFVIIGYTFKGEKIVIGHAMTQQENDSLTEHLRQTFLRVMNNMDN